MHLYRLSQYPQSAYDAAFAQANLEIQPAIESGYYEAHDKQLVMVAEKTENSWFYMEQPETANLVIEVEDLEFSLEVESVDGVVPADIWKLTQEVMAQIVELDNFARSIPSDYDYEEHLAYVVISHKEIQLHYFASTVNTEWGVYFTRDELGKFHFKTMG